MDPDFDTKFPGWRTPPVGPDRLQENGWPALPTPAQRVDDDPYAELRDEE